MNDEEVFTMGQQVAQCFHKSTVDGASPLRASESEDHLPSRGDLERKVCESLLAGLDADGAANGVSHDHSVFFEKGKGLGKGQEHAVHPPPQKGIQLSRNTVLFVKKDLRRGEPQCLENQGGDDDGCAYVSAGGDDPPGCEAKENEEGLSDSKRETTKESQSSKRWLQARKAFRGYKNEGVSHSTHNDGFRLPPDSHVKKTGVGLPVLDSFRNGKSRIDMPARSTAGQNHARLTRSDSAPAPGNQTDQHQKKNSKKNNEKYQVTLHKFTLKGKEFPYEALLLIVFKQTTTQMKATQI